MDLYWSEEGVFDIFTNPHSSKGDWGSLPLKLEPRSLRVVHIKAKSLEISVVNGLGESPISIIERRRNFMKRVEISLQVTHLVQNAISEATEGNQTKWIYTNC